MENTNNYSDDWQQYTGDYDKFEYDIILKDGTLVTNCFPNARKFLSFSEEHERQSFSEDLVDKIRFTQSPKIVLENDHSQAYQEFMNNLNLSGLDLITYFESFKTLKQIVNEDIMYDTNQHYWQDLSLPPVHKKFYERGHTYIKPEVEINRNDICPCNSGKKYKKCCMPR